MPIPSHKDRSFISLAAKVASMVNDNHKLGAVVVKGGRVLAHGKNFYGNGRHAEECALFKVDIPKLRGATLYIARLRKEQPYGLSKPCIECEKLIREYGIRRIVYTTNCPVNYIAEEYL